ncbi:hypothetical protein ATK74_2892 [Propionicimonas paludicola]|uniref:Uncharacterized protein n=1 Tax=Propionicimonas paludicola TaxID=185243 RepID=A0A2A9CV80_9ACTN|nr:hypothetical protein [Propionicimonas paludicola]PFG18308.1 hypothetical protein ATK74_2892 [Propionicimonas paludicola]
MRDSVRGGVASLVLLGFLVGCQAAPDSPLLTARPAQTHMAAALSGTVSRADNGCYLLNGMPLVWPNGTTAVRDKARLADGREFMAGSTVSGGGGFMNAGDVAVVLDEASASKAATCLGSGEVAVLQVIS